MALRFETFFAEGISQLSYLVGDDGARTACIVDPRPDIAPYLEAARRYGVQITHIFETHIHADLMSGSRELSDRLGGVPICASVEGGAEYGFKVQPVRDGDAFTFGGTTLTARHTPGHTPEHIAYELANAEDRASPWGVLTGDSLFVGSAGRPDLIGAHMEEQLVEALYATLRDYFLKLDDGVMIFPGHGRGSACGPSMGDRAQSTIGLERASNPYLRYEPLEAFKRRILSSSPAAPAHYPQLKKINAAGPPVLGPGPRVPLLTAQAFGERMEAGALVVDTRHMLAFGAGHIPGSLSIAAKPDLSVWAGWLIEPERDILLVVEDPRRLDEIVALFVRTGRIRITGCLAGGISAWEEAGEPLRQMPAMTVHEMAERRDGLQVLDVREPSEWKGGRIPGAVHGFVPTLLNDGEALDPDATTVTYCHTGFRACIAGSILQQRGFRDVRWSPGSYKAWRAAGFPIENGGA